MAIEPILMGHLMAYLACRNNFPGFPIKIEMKKGAPTFLIEKLFTYICSHHDRIFASAISQNVKIKNLRFGSIRPSIF
jgi:hypothetical protein